MSVENLFHVNGVVAVVTGGGTGIGLMIAQALDANGAEAVYIVGRRQDILDKASKTAVNGRIIPIQGDVTSRPSMQSLVSRVERDHGRLDVLVNSAGVMSILHKDFQVPQDGSIESLQQTLLAEAEADWATQFSVNVTAVYFVTAACLKLLEASNAYWKKQSKTREDEGSSSPTLSVRTAQVITVSGIAAHFRNMGACMGYAASKSGSMHLMKTLSTVLAPTGIRFNCLAPGIFPTEMTAGKGHLDDENRNHLGPIERTKVPLGRAGNAKDMAGAILFLCGSSGFYCSGSVVVVDGGRLSVAPATY